MVVFGGVGPTGIRFNDVWALSNANGLGGTPVWTQITSTGGPPSPRRGATAVYNPTSNRMTIYAGLDSDCSATGDLWVLSNVATPPPTPTPTPTPCACETGPQGPPGPQGPEGPAG